MDNTTSRAPYPEINVQIPSLFEFPVANLEGNSHFVIFVELFEEAFASMPRELDVMSCRDSKKRTNCQQAC